MYAGVLAFSYKFKFMGRYVMKAVVRVLFALVFAVTAFALPSAGFSAEKVYQEGNVWHITYVRTRPGMFDKYMENLKVNWKVQMDGAAKKGIVLSYNILTKEPTSPADWDLMLVEQYKNMAAFDGMDEKMEAVAKEVSGQTTDQMSQKAVERGALRDILGMTVVRDQKIK
jgi:hypothetical protein